MKKIFFPIFCVLLVVFSNAQQKPNIIYILADDLGYGDVSCLNIDSKIHTINIDQLASQGLKFTDAHSNSAVCSPTRYGILTGRYDWRSSLQNGVLWSYDTPLIDSKRMTIASLLKSDGYHTACIGKWHLGLGWQKNAKGEIDLLKPITEGPNQLGFEYFFGITASLDIPPYVYIQNDRVTATSIDTIEGTTGKGFWRRGPIGNDFHHAEVLPKMTEKAVDYIKTNAKSSQPFFLYLAFPSPHTPILPSREFLGKSGTNVYGDFVLMTDFMVGKILKAIKDAGIEDNTLVIFTSDNGCSPAANFKELAAVGHHPSYHFRGAKADIFDGGHRIPFIAKWPGKIKAGSFSDTTICLTDFLATGAEIIHKKLPENAGEDSYSLLPILFSKTKEKYGRTNIVHHSIDGNFALRKGNWKLEFCGGSGGWSFPTAENLKTLKLPKLQLYNMKTDLGEKNNLEKKFPGKVNELTKLMDQIIKNGRSTPGQNQANDVPVDLWKNKNNIID